MRTGTLTSPKEIVPDQIARGFEDGMEDLVPRGVTALTPRIQTAVSAVFQA
jgi:hypothetical protein